ncbi:inorganic phosphate transporter [bacterium]|nr:inorganic phosphate transporter [bacterium]
MEIETLLLILAVVAGGYMAWNIGANDVANAMGTSVGSKALTLAKAVLVAAVFEFAGAFFVGSRVTNTIAKGIISLDVVANHEMEFACGMVASLFAAAIWLNLATRLGWPVSTTHSIVGAVIGFGIVLGGLFAVSWSEVGKIVMSWIVSPIAGAILAVIVYWLIVLPIYRSKTPARQLRIIVPPATGMVFFMLSLSMLYKGLKNLNLDLRASDAIVMAAVVGTIAGGIAHMLMRRRKLSNGTTYLARFRQTEPVFAILQVITACYMAFAHGANDVANSIGPLAAVVSSVQTHVVSKEAPVPLWILGLGGVGIVIGLATYGHRVIATIGKRITSITPSRGFSAEFGAATTVLVCSKLGLPVSTTHTLVGAVVGVGLARGIRGLDLQVVRDIGVSWLATIPFTAVLTVIIYFGLAQFLPR